MIKLIVVKNSDKSLRNSMSVHYSAPKGFVGRNICYAVYYNDVLYGHTVGGSATRFLPGRNEYLGIGIDQLNNVINNTFFHIYKVDNRYPIRNFAQRVVAEWRRRVATDWVEKYGDPVIGFETLVELPRTGECYRRDGWVVTGTTIGYTCKRTAGNGTDSWTGKRVWNTKELRPKLVLCRRHLP